MVQQGGQQDSWDVEQQCSDGCAVERGWVGRGAHAGCSASSFRCCRLLCRMPRSSLSALRARWNAAHRRPPRTQSHPHALPVSVQAAPQRANTDAAQHGETGAASACSQPARPAAAQGRTEARQVDGHAEQALQPDAERLAAARQQRVIDRVLLEAQDDLQGDLPAAPRPRQRRRRRETLGARSRQALGATRNVYSLDLSKPLTRPCCSQAAQQRCAMSTICGTNTATALAVKAGLRICAPRPARQQRLTSVTGPPAGRGTERKAGRRCCLCMKCRGKHLAKAHVRIALRAADRIRAQQQVRRLGPVACEAGVCFACGLQQHLRIQCTKHCVADKQCIAGS